MATTPARRLATLFLVLTVPGLASLSWFAWQGLENSVRDEGDKVLRFEELAAGYVASSLRFEINRVRFVPASGPDEILAAYRSRSRFPQLIEAVSLTRSGRPENDINLDDPVMNMPLPGGQVLEVRYSVKNLVESVVPALIREALSATGSGPGYEAWVFRLKGVPKDARKPDLAVPLVSRAFDPPPIPDAARIRQYLPPTYPVESPWLLGVRVLPGGLLAYLADFRMRNLIWTGAVISLVALGAGLFLTSLLRLFGAMRRERAFSTLVSHELKTPLAALSSLSENLAEGVITNGERVREYGVQMLEQTDRLNGMLGSILSLASLESSEAVLKREVFDAVLLAREMAVPLGLVVESPEMTWSVRGNRAAIRAALDNLLTNARRYGAKEGEPPVIEVELVPGYRWGTSWVGISVSDHGPGLNRDEIAKLFRPYFRGRQADRRQIPGAGIGLRMVWATMRHLGGRIQVKAVPGGGLCLILWLREVER